MSFFFEARIANIPTKLKQDEVGGVPPEYKMNIYTSYDSNIKFETQWVRNLVFWRFSVGFLLIIQILNKFPLSFFDVKKIEIEVFSRGNMCINCNY